MHEYLTVINKFKIPCSFTKLRIIFMSLVVGMFSFGIAESFKNGEIIWKIARNESGELAWNLMIFIIFVGLLSKLFAKNKLLQQISPLRKHAGILVFLIVCAHALFHFLRAGVLGDWELMYFQAVERDWAILLGTISFGIMLPLFLTSTSFAVKKMGYKSWKFLQRFAHVAFVLSAVHVAFIEFSKHSEIEFGPLVVLSAYFLGYLWLFIKTKKMNLSRK